MAATLRRDRGTDRGSVPGAVLLVLLLVVTTTVAALAPAGDRPAAAGRAHRTTALGDVRAPAGQPADPATGLDAAVAPPGDTPRAPAKAKTMSMDAPIQGGLTAHQAQAASATVLRAHDDPGVAPATDRWTPAMGRTAVARARSWLGMPYSWAGGSASGPTPGRCDTGAGADLDCHIVGFDCSGLMMFAWGPYTALPHFAQTQRDAGGFHPTVKQLRPGDMVFFSGYLAGGIGHVAIYEGDGKVIEAPQSGSVVRESTLADLIAHDGTYRGAVRPLTTPTPTLTRPHTLLPRRGGTVTLHGAHLSGVTSLTVGTHTRPVVSRSDTTLTLTVPRSPADRRVVVSVATSWGDSSKPVTLTYAKAPAKHAPAKHAPTKHAPVKPTKPTPVKPTKPTPVKPTKPTPPSTSPSKPTPPSTSPTKPTPPSTSPTKPTTSTAPSPTS